VSVAANYSARAKKIVESSFHDFHKTKKVEAL
jgi:hypothetical protein